MTRNNLHILFNSAKFSAGWSLLPAYILLATMAFTSGTYRLRAVASLKLLVTEMCLELL